MAAVIDQARDAGQRLGRELGDRVPTPFREAWRHPRLGPVLRVVVLYVVLVEICIQFLFGRIELNSLLLIDKIPVWKDIPLLNLEFLEVGLQNRTIPREVFLDGAVLGTLHALVAMGLILVYRANRIINFAQAQLGAVPASAGLLLIAIKGWPYLVVLPLMLVAAALLGAGVETTVIRRFSKAPRLILTAATIGVGFVLLVAEFVVKNNILGGDLLSSAAVEFPTPWNRFEWQLGIVPIKGDHIFTVAIVALLAAGLGAFFKYTDIGIAVRASAENGDRAALLGIPVRRVSTVVWTIAAVLSAVGIFLRAPLVGLPLTGFVGPSILLFGLVTAVMAKMEHLPVAVLAGMFLGIIEKSAVFGTGTPSLADATLVPVVLIALFAVRSNVSRAHDTGTATWQASADVRPVPKELRHLPEIAWMRIAAGAVTVLVALAAPFVITGQYSGLATQGLVFAMVGVSLVILTGWSGQISLGQFAITGVGAATAGGLAANHHWDFFVTLFVAGLVGALVAILIGLPALRIQGLFLAVTTLTFAFAVERFVLDRRWFDWLLPDASDFVEVPILYGRWDLAGDSEILGVTLGVQEKMYFVTLFFLALTVLVARSLRVHRSGRILIGVRDNGRAMQAFGVNLARTRLAAFAISGFIAALAGALFVYQQGSVDPSTYSPQQSITVFVMTVIGGIGSIPGALLGAAYLLGTPRLPIIREFDQAEALIAGLGVLVVLYAQPSGLAGGLYALRDRLLRRVAARHSIHVPSLVADSLQKTGRPEDVTPPAGPGSPADPVDPETDPVGPATGPTLEPLLSLRGVEVSYDQVQVLFGVDFDVYPGETVALLGTNGAGKSTIFKAISGLVDVGGGTITFAGRDITNVGPLATVKAGLVQVPGGKAVFPTLTVAEHIKAAGWLYRDDPEYMAQAEAEILDIFPRLAERYEQLAGNLSGGEQQMLGLAMAFIAKPEILLIDELSLGLAPAIVEQLLVIVRRIQESGTAVIVVEQSINVALTIAERAYFLEKGEVRFEGATVDLLERDDIVRSVFLTGGADVEPAQIARPELASREELAIASDIRHDDFDPTSPILELNAVSLSFGGIRAVDDTSFELMPGEILGLIGPNGAGKTTIFDLISGFHVPAGGRIRFKGHDITELGPDARAWLGLGRSFQDARLIPSLTVAENLAIGLERHLEHRDHVAAALHLPGVVRLEDDVAWSVEDLVELMNLEAFRDKFVRELSTGSRRIVDLAMCIAHEPDVLLLDEPSSGIAQKETEALGPVLRRIQAETGCAMLIIEHDMPLITGISDRMIALELGHPLSEGTPAEVISDPRVVESYLGGDPASINRSGRDRPPSAAASDGPARSATAVLTRETTGRGGEADWDWEDRDEAVLDGDDDLTDGSASL